MLDQKEGSEALKKNNSEHAQKKEKSMHSIIILCFFTIIKGGNQLMKKVP